MQPGGATRAPSDGRFALMEHLRPPPPPLTAAVVELQDIYRLNESQAQCVAAASHWTQPVRGAAAAAADDAPGPLVLVQGPFGCGKTATLAALVRHLAASLDASRSTERILLAGATNACVDRLLCALLDGGYTGFIRVGPRRRLATRILPYSLPPEKGNAKAELNALLAEACSAQERAVISMELKDLEEGRSAARSKRLSTIRVVATTIASCASASLSGQQFSFVVLDEASQLTGTSLCAS